MADPTTSSTSTTTSGSSGSTTAAASSTGSPASPGSETTASRRKKRRSTRAKAKIEIGMAKTRDKVLQRYVKFLAGLKKYGATPGFPNFFADTKFTDAMTGFIDQLKAMATAQVDRRDATGKAAAARTQATVVLDGGEGALIAFYGPQNPVLLDFGVPPVHSKARKRKAHHGTATGASTSGGGTSGGTTTEPSTGSTPSAASPGGTT